MNRWAAERLRQERKTFDLAKVPLSGDDLLDWVERHLGGLLHTVMSGMAPNQVAAHVERRGGAALASFSRPALSRRLEALLV